MQRSRSFHTPALLAAVAVLCCLAAVGARAQTISYLLPDVAAPGMNTQVDIIGPQSAAGNFGADGFSLNNPGDALRVVCVNPADTAKVTIGPCVVSWNGRLVSTQVFVHPGVTPNSADWQALQSEYIIPIQVVVNGTPSNADNLYLVRPQAAIAAAAGGVLGAGGLGQRSRRGAMIVDSVALGDALFTVSTADCDPATPGNQGYLPFVLISRGPVRGTTTTAMTTISVDAPGKDGGPGGGGGGGNYCDVSGSGSNGGAGFTGGGRGGKNGSGVPGNSDSWMQPGAGTGPTVNGTGTSLNGVPGGTSTAYEASGGGTGHPFGTSGQGCNDGLSCSAPGGYGGGSGQQQTRGGGAGGYATLGLSSALLNGGQPHGNEQLVPLAGGSGGAGGNPQGIMICSGEGGGGGGAIRIAAPTVNDLAVTAAGGGGQPRSNGPGGSGSGGAISVECKLAFERGSVTARGGSTGLEGGAGRLRRDGARNTIVVLPTTASDFRGPTTDTLQYVPRSFTLTGTGSGERVHLYLKSAGTPWFECAVLAGYAGNQWSQPITLPGNELIYYLAALQETTSPASSQYAAEPSLVLSQAAANIFRFVSFPRIAVDAGHGMVGTICEQEIVDSVTVRNEGDGPLAITALQFANGSRGISVLRPTAFPATVPPRDSTHVLLAFRPIPGAMGFFRDTLLVYSNDTSAARNPSAIALVYLKDSAGFAPDPASVDFGRLLACRRRSADTVITLRNTGTTPLLLGVPQLTGGGLELVSPPPSAFPLVLDTISRAMPLLLRFTPQQQGVPFSGSLRFQADTAGCFRAADIAWTGRGDTAGVSAPDSLRSLAAACFGSTDEDAFDIANTGTEEITVAAPVAGDPSFTVVSPAFPLVIPAGERRSVRVSYAAATPGSVATTLAFTAEPCDLAFAVTLRGRRDSLRVAGSSYDFGLHPPTAFPLASTVMLRNTGSVPAVIQGAAFRNGTPFTHGAALPITIAPGDSAAVPVTFTDPGGDGTYSDSLILDYAPSCAQAGLQLTGSRGTAAVTLVVDTVRGNPGDGVTVTIRLRSSLNPRLFGASGIATRLRYRSSLLAPSIPADGSTDGAERLMDLRLPLSPDARGVLAELPFLAMLGDTDQCTLSLEGSAGIGGDIAITEVPGRFELTGICREGGARLFSASARALLERNHPNPFNPVTEIAFETMEEGPSELFVTDLLGRRVATLASGALAVGRHTVRFEAGALPSGVYLYTLRTPSALLTRSMMVAK